MWFGLGKLGAVLLGATTSWTPAALFANGEPGGWYDPSDFTTLFQDAAGTTPVTAVERPVGLVLDKSRGLVPGPELVPTPYVGGSSGAWVVGATSITRNGSATGQATFTLSSTLSTSKSYRVVFTVSNLSGDTFYVRLSNGTVNQVTSNGTYSALLIPGATTGTMTFAPWGGVAGDVTITNVSVKEIPGAHLTQSTAASRPVLSARVNLLTYTEQFDNAAWLKEGTLTTTARSISFPSSATDRLMQLATTPAVPTNLTVRIPFSVSDAGKKIRFGIWASGLDGMSSGLSADITIPSDGIVTYTRNNVTSLSLIGIINGSAGASQTVTLASSGGIDLRPSNAGVGLPAYQRVGASTDYDTTDFPLYLKFDGTDDFLVSGTINPGSVDKAQVFAGVRKISDAASACLAELSVNTNLNAGSFAVFAPSSAMANYFWRSYGNANVADATTANSYPAPITNVLTGQGDIASDVSAIRVNGALSGSSSADQGSGNYNAYPLYVGKRGGSTSYFNGHLYSLILRFSATNLDAAIIASTETWVNSKCKAY